MFHALDGMLTEKVWWLEYIDGGAVCQSCGKNRPGWEGP